MRSKRLSLVETAALILFALLCAMTAKGAPVAGQLGGDLALLQTFYAAPTADQGNCFLDLWDGAASSKVRALATAAGLTNNRTLFVNSHGSVAPTGHGYCFYPHSSQPGPDQAYSAKDLATVLGPAALEIHNILFASCDMDRAFSAAEVRRWFPNATNITHIAAGEAGYQPMFIQAFLSRSSDVQPLYETSSLTAQGTCQYQLSAKPDGNAKKLTPYMAEMFKPGAKKPFRRQVAGREFLEGNKP